MASGGGPNNGGHLAGASRGVSSDDMSKSREVRVFHKDCTLLVDVSDNRKVKASELIDSIEEVGGHGSVYACIPRASDTYEITVAEEGIVDLFSDGVLVNGHNCKCTEIGHSPSRPMLVSLMHLPAYIQDQEIREKLSALDVKIVGDIRRRYYPGSDVTDGTRLVKVILPPTLKSLPYTMRFASATGNQYFRVIHNNQIKLCRICSADDHLMVNCPNYVCHQCGVQGHVRRNCLACQCDTCYKYGNNCTCDSSGEKMSEHENIYAENKNVARRCISCRCFACTCGEESDDDWRCNKCGNAETGCKCDFDEAELEAMDKDSVYGDSDGIESVSGVPTPVLAIHANNRVNQDSHIVVGESEIRNESGVTPVSTAVSDEASGDQLMDTSGQIETATEQSNESTPLIGKVNTEAIVHVNPPSNLSCVQEVIAEQSSTAVLDSNVVKRNTRPPNLLHVLDIKSEPVRTSKRRRKSVIVSKVKQIAKGTIKLSK